MKRTLLGLLVAVLTLPIAEASTCVCSWSPFVLGTKKITNKSEVTTLVFLAATPKIQKNGNIVCQGIPLKATVAPTKSCNTGVESSLNLDVSLGSNFGLPDWAAVELKASAGIKYSTACAASISSWCSCCICVCYIPKTVITAEGFCEGTWYKPTLGFGQCSKAITDTATSYGWLDCTNDWDDDHDGKDDCWNSMPKPCQTSCDDGSH